MYGLLVAADKRAAEVYALEIVFLGLQVGDLADVVTTFLSVLCVAFVEVVLT